MQNLDQYKLLYNNLWLHKSTEPIKEITEEKIQELSSQIQLKNTAVSTPTTDTDTLLTEEIAKRSANSELILDWDNLVNEINKCNRCVLCNSRKNVVIERGSRQAKWLFVGEGPGEQEDLQGKPFVGASGQLLQKMIEAMKLNPETDVYICNVVKCRPPSNRNPEAQEIQECRNYLYSQIELVKPQIIITLGRFAYQTLLNTEVALGKLRLKQHTYKDIPLIVTYHPAYLLRNPSAKKDAWADLQLAMKVFESTGNAS